MHNEARVRAYEAAAADPHAFLQQHYHLTPTTALRVIREQFTAFGRATGVGLATVNEAVQKFRVHQDVAPFVLQAASAEKADAYETA